jgi:acyl-homoserine lactone acylase PvdQ
MTLHRGKPVLATVVVVVVGALAASSASAADDAARAYNIVPSGQYGSIPIPPNADEQALMYDGLTPLFDEVTDADLDTYFKSSLLGVGPDGPGTPEEVPRDGVTIIRDAYGVPHVEGETTEDGIWASGWLLAEDRGLLLAQARYNARVAAIDVPNMTALGLITQLANFEPSEQTESEIAKQTKVLKQAGKEGKQVLADIDTFLDGINAYLAENSPGTEPWTRNDVYAVNALKGQFLGQGGGDEARRTMFLDSLQTDLGKKTGTNVFNDLRQFKNKELASNVDGKFNYGSIPKKPKGNVLIDSGSYEESSAVGDAAVSRRFDVDGGEASNTLQINSELSSTGTPLMVGGPQIGYFYPGFTYEIDMDAGDMQWRGVTSAPFPGYLLIGRGEDFANTLTSASGDIIDQYAETLCGGSDTKYKYKGKCRSMETFDAGTLNGDPVTFKTTVHGPVTGYATVNGKKVAISSKRSSYGKDVLDQLFFRRLSVGKVDSPKSFYNAAAKTPQTFNSFYIDDDDNAVYTSGLLPERPKGVDPGLLTKGTGGYEWEGFLSKNEHPHGANPSRGRIVNWNQNVAKGFGTADDEWMRAGSVGRVNLLNRNLKQHVNGDGTWDLVDLAASMNAAATQDVRTVVTVPLLNRLLQGSEPPNAQAKTMLALMKNWRAQGATRLDRDLDGKIDHPGAATMDGAWDNMANAFMGGRLNDDLLDELNTLAGRFDDPPGGQYSGWYQYFDRDVRKLLGENIRAPFKVSYCGAGKLKKCQADVWAAIAESGAQLQAEYGSADPNTWLADANDERITFAPGLLTTTMRYTNRPSGYQQAITFKGN